MESNEQHCRKYLWRKDLMHTDDWLVLLVEVVEGVLMEVVGILFHFHSSRDIDLLDFYSETLFDSCERNLLYSYYRKHAFE